MAINTKDESLSSLRQIDIRVYVLNYRYKVLNEISGLIESASISIDADSDIRRTINIAMVLSQGGSMAVGDYPYYNNDKRYHKGDVVQFGDKLYQCINTNETEIDIIDENCNRLTDSNGNFLTMKSGDGTYIMGISPLYTLFWSEYTQGTFSSSRQYWQTGNPYWFDKYIKIEIGVKNKEYYQYDTTDDYDSTRAYYIGDVVKYGQKLYQCKTVSATPLNLLVKGATYGTTRQLLVYDDTTQTPPTTSTLRAMSTDDVYLKNIPPTNVNYWMEIEEYTWTNQGIYMINTPSITYNATDNILSFQAVDLMSKLTGMRNGYLEGMTYQIKAGASINGSIKTILEEQGFTQMILNPQSSTETNTTPIDLNIDIGSTAYDLLTQLRDINPNWEMFFDVNGVFRFQQIPSGEGEVSEFGDEVWDKVGLGYNLDTSFEDVKNYIEIVGKQIEPDETATVTYSGNTATVTLARTWASYKSSSSEANVVWYIGFTIGDLTQAYEELATPITSIIVKDSVGSVMHTITIPNDKPAIYYNNESYFLRLTFDSNGYVEGSFAGYLQPRAIAFENNPESPFYVGDAIEHTCHHNNLRVEFVEEGYSGYIYQYTISGNNGEADLDITTGLDYKQFESAQDGAQWAFKVKAYTHDVPITTINLTYGGGASTDYKVKSGSSTYDNYDVKVTEGGSEYTDYYVSGSSITTLSDQPIYKNSTFTSDNTISLDFDSTYLLIVEKYLVSGNTHSLRIIGKYYPISSQHWPTPTTKVHNMPRFNKMVRGVFSGDEYDNIYTNDLAQQRAKYELYLNCRLHDTINIDCVPLYWLDVNKLVTYTADVTSTDNQWIIKAINTDVSVNGTQSVTAMRYYPLYN